MYELTIPAMSCGHCQKTITQALRELDSTATLNFDMAAHKLALGTKAGLSVVKQALDDAGYPVVEAVEGKRAGGGCHCDMCD